MADGYLSPRALGSSGLAVSPLFLARADKVIE